MKKRTAGLFILVFIFSAGTICGQDHAEKEKLPVYAKLGYGMGDVIPMISSRIDIDYTGEKNFHLKYPGSLSIKIDPAISNRFSLGINFAYMYHEISYSIDLGTSDTYTNVITINAFVIDARVNWHIAPSSHFDPYLGAGAGYCEFHNRFSGTDPYFTNSNYKSDLRSPLAMELMIGSNFLISEHWGAYFETGFEMPLFQFGAIYKL